MVLPLNGRFVINNKQATFCVMVLPIMAGSNLKLDLELDLEHLMWMHFYGTYPSIKCTHGTSDVTHTLG
jgi:hypothetical protein